MRRSYFALASITLVILHACFEYGGVTPREWGYCLIAIAGCGVALWWPTRAPGSPPPLPRALVTGLILAVCAIGLQLVPFPLGWLKVLDPARAELTAALNGGGFGNSSWAAPSVAPVLTFAHLQRVLSYLVVFFMARQVSWRLGERKWLTAIPVIAAGTFEAALGLAQYFGGAARATGTYVNPNHFAALLHMALPVAVMLAAWSYRRSVAAACFFMTCSAVTTVGALDSLSRMSLVTLFACVGILAMLGWRRQRMLSAGATVAVVLILLFAVPARLVDRFAVTSELRTQFRHEAVDLFAAYPLLGSGLGTYGSAIQKYRNSAPTSLVDFAHNDYLQILAETGVAGAVPFFFCAAWLFLAPWRAALSRSRSKDRWLAVACAAALSGLALDCTVDFDFYVPANMLVAAWIAGLGVTTAERSPGS